MQTRSILAALLLLAAATARAGDPAELARGRFILAFGGCNDCHTAGYMAKEGQVPESEWLLGSDVGLQGPWGTTYPTNLRLLLAAMTEDQWLQSARARRLPPMPWFNLARLDDADLRAMYRYIRSLGPAGREAPAYVAPGGTVTTPFIVFVPQMPAAGPSASTAATRP